LRLLVRVLLEVEDLMLKSIIISDVCMKTELFVLNKSVYIDRERVEEQGLFWKEQVLLSSLRDGRSIF